MLAITVVLINIKEKKCTVWNCMKLFIVISSLFLKFVVCILKVTPTFNIQMITPTVQGLFKFVALN